MPAPRACWKVSIMPEQFGTLAGRGAAGERGGVGRQDFGDQQRLFPCEPAQVVPRREPQRNGVGNIASIRPASRPVQDIDLLIGLEQLFAPLVACPREFLHGPFRLHLRAGTRPPGSKKSCSAAYLPAAGCGCPARGRSRVQVSPVRPRGLCPGKQCADAFYPAGR